MWLLFEKLHLQGYNLQTPLTHIYLGWAKNMVITDLNSVQQAIANIRLESLELSEQLQSLLQKALFEGCLDTTDTLNALRNG